MYKGKRAVHMFGKKLLTKNTNLGVVHILRYQLRWEWQLIHDVNPSQLSGASHRPSLREALLDARRDTVTHRATRVAITFGPLGGHLYC